MVEALGAGDVAKAIELFRPELSEKLSVAGTPEECVEKIKTDIEPAGVNHMILALSDSHLVEFFWARESRAYRTSGASCASWPTG